MPDAKSVDGAPAPRPLIRKRVIRKPGEPAVAPPAPTPAPAISAPPPPMPAAVAPIPAPAPLPPPPPPPQPRIGSPAGPMKDNRDQRGDFRPRNNNNGDRGDFRPRNDHNDAPRQPVRPPRDPNEPRGPALRLDDLYRMPMPQLFKMAEGEGIHENSGMNRAQLIIGVVRKQIERGEVVKGSGTLEVLPDGYGFLRSAAHNYLASPEDIYVSPSQIRRMSLRTGYIVEGPIRLPIENQDNFALMQIEIVNAKPAEEATSLTGFADLTPLHPNAKFRLETTADEISMRIVDLVTPIGKGQRALIVAPPRTGKTILLSKMANSIMKNHPEAYVFVLLIDERPEEVTEMQRLVQGTNAEVVASTFDEPSEEHIHIADIVLEKAKRMVEQKRDVVILLDSITRLARAHNQEAPGGGKLLSGGLDSNAMQKPKQFFGAARNVEEGGSLTIIATALIETGSRMDDVIFEEFKGTGNMELHLDRRLVEKRIYPAIDVNRSGTRKEDLLLTPEELGKMAILRRVLSDMHPVEAMELLINRGKKTKSNAEFLITMNLN